MLDLILYQTISYVYVKNNKSLRISPILSVIIQQTIVLLLSILTNYCGTLTWKWSSRHSLSEVWSSKIVSPPPSVEADTEESSPLPKVHLQPQPQPLPPLTLAELYEVRYNALFLFGMHICTLYCLSTGNTAIYASSRVITPLLAYIVDFIVSRSSPKAMSNCPKSTLKYLFLDGISVLVVVFGTFSLSSEPIKLTSFLFGLVASLCQSLFIASNKRLLLQSQTEASNRLQKGMSVRRMMTHYTLLSLIIAAIGALMLHLSFIYPFMTFHFWDISDVPNIAKRGYRSPLESPLTAFRSVLAGILNFVSAYSGNTLLKRHSPVTISLSHQFKYALMGGLSVGGVCILGGGIAHVVGVEMKNRRCGDVDIDKKTS